MYYFRPRGFEPQVRQKSTRCHGLVTEATLCFESERKLT